MNARPIINLPRVSLGFGVDPSLKYGVQQGAILGPLPFYMYKFLMVLFFFHIIYIYKKKRKHNVSNQFHVDVTVLQALTESLSL